MTALLKELWQFREVAIVLTWRELVVRYKRSAAGILWSLAEPIMLIFVFTVVFGYFLKAGTGSAESYIAFSVFGVLPWSFLATSIAHSAPAMIAHAPLIKKSYFPREYLVFSVILSRFSTTLVGFALAIPIFAFLGMVKIPSFSVAIGFIVGLTALVALSSGVSLLGAALNAIMRDVHFILQFGLRLFMYACPVVYPFARVPEEFQPYYQYNPLVTVLWLSQRIADPTLQGPSLSAQVTSIVFCFLTGAIGWFCFRKLQWRVADLL